MSDIQDSVVPAPGKVTIEFAPDADATADVISYVEPRDGIVVFDGRRIEPQVARAIGYRLARAADEAEIQRLMASVTTPTP